MPGPGSFDFKGTPRSFHAVDLERIRRSIALLAPRQPSGLDREAAMALLEELQRLQNEDRRVNALLDQVAALLATARETEQLDGR